MRHYSAATNHRADPCHSGYVCVRSCERACALGNGGVTVEGSPDSGTLHAPCTVYSVGASRGGSPPKTATPRRPSGIGVHVVTTCPLSPPFSLLATLFLPSPHFFPVRLTKRASELLEFSDVIDLATRNKSKSERRDLFASLFIY